VDCLIKSQVKWLRVVLDEGHFVKNSDTQQSRAATALSARSRWIISGTPIQNSMKDLFGLVSFLHLQPLCERSVFRSSFERPMAMGDKAALMHLKLLMAAVALRRLKTTEVNGRPLVQLPPKMIEFVEVDLPETQRELYDRWEAAGRAAVSSHIENGTLFRNYSSVLEIILRCVPSHSSRDRTACLVEFAT
jgi:SWI/SNF-related matrix-associated actin-dependent regulator of chromatin subfamily A3